MSQLIAWFNEHSTMVFAILFGISEMLDAIPALKASSIWKIVYDFIKAKAGK